MPDTTTISLYLAYYMMPDGENSCACRGDSLPCVGRLFSPSIYSEV